MRVLAVEWSSGASLEAMVEAWSVAATIEVILKIRVMEKQDVVESFLERYRD